MMEKEFERRTGISLRTELYEYVEQEYYESELDKDAFCKKFLESYIPFGVLDATFLIVAGGEKREISKEKICITHSLLVTRLVTEG